MLSVYTSRGGASYLSFGHVLSAHEPTLYLLDRSLRVRSKDKVQREIGPKNHTYRIIYNLKGHKTSQSCQ